MAVLLLGIFMYKTNYYKGLYEQRKNWTAQTFCNDDSLKAINFLLNSEDNSFTKARVVVALKDNVCLSDYPVLIESAEVVVEKESEVVKSINNVDTASVDLLKEFEKDPLLLFSDSKNVESEKILELNHLVVKFNEELDKRSDKELEKLWGVENLDDWEVVGIEE